MPSFLIFMSWLGCEQTILSNILCLTASCWGFKSVYSLHFHHFHVSPLLVFLPLSFSLSSHRNIFPIFLVSPLTHSSQLSVHPKGQSHPPKRKITCSPEHTIALSLPTLYANLSVSASGYSWFLDHCLVTW